MKLLVIVAAFLAAVLTFPPASSPAGATSPPPMLPGEPVLSGGVGAYDFGYNNGPEWAAGFSAHSSVQQAVRSAGLTLDRIWGSDNLCSGGSCSSTTAPGTGAGSGDVSSAGVTVGQKIAAMRAAGGTCMLELVAVWDLNWLKSMVSTYGNGTCPYFEFGNEPDNTGNPGIGPTTTDWNNDVSTLKGLCTSTCYFGGPAPTWSGGNDSTYTAGSTCGLMSSGCATDLEYFLAHASPAPDFVTYHNYSCTGESSKASCLTDAQGDISYNWNNTQTQETDVLGKVIPTGITEMNFDAGNHGWGSDSTFISSYQQKADAEIQTLGIPFVTFYTMQDFSNGQEYFSDTSPYTQTSEFTRLASDASTAGASATSGGIASTPPDSSWIDANITPQSPFTAYQTWSLGVEGYLEEAGPNFTTWYHDVFVPWINYENTPAGGSHGYANGDSTQPTSSAGPCTGLPDWSQDQHSGSSTLLNMCLGLVAGFETETGLTAWVDQVEHEGILHYAYNASPTLYPDNSNPLAYNE